MKKRKSVRLIWGLAVIFLITAGFGYAQHLKIRVTVENASIHAKTDVGSQVIGFPPLGSVLEVVSKNLPWYEVKVKTSLGVEVTGFIHEMYVQEMELEEVEKKEKSVDEPQIKEETKDIKRQTEKKTEEESIRKPPKQTIRMKEEAGFPSKAYPKAGISLMGGITSGNFLNDSSSYSKVWDYYLLDKVDEKGSINHPLGSPMEFGAAFHYLFTGGFGVQLRADINGKEKIENKVSSWSQTWTWISGRGPYTHEGEWGVNGSLSMSALSLNLIWQLQKSPVFQPFISGGVSYFSGSCKINTVRGYGLSFFSSNYEWQYIDYVEIPVNVEADLSGVGFNVGGGFNLMFTRNVGFTINAIYFIKSSFTQEWSASSGKYYLVNNSNYYVDVSVDDAAEIASQLDPIEINPSFFKIQGGISLCF